MKTLLLFVLSVSLQAHAEVVSYEDPRCPTAISTHFKVLPEQMVAMTIDGEELTLDGKKAGNHIRSKLRAWDSSFIAAGDPLMRFSLVPICAGMYDDSDGPNAMAAGENFIVFGAHLTVHLQKTMKLPGQLAITGVLAHEFGHTIQNRHGLKFNYTLPMLSTKIKELHADCLAASILRIHNEFSVSDYQVGERLMHVLGDQHAVGDHGVSEERRLAFRRGINVGTMLLARGERVLTIESGDLVRECGQYYRPTK